MALHFIGHFEVLMASSSVVWGVNLLKVDCANRSFCWPVFCQSWMNFRALTRFEIGRELRYRWCPSQLINLKVSMDQEFFVKRY